MRRDDPARSRVRIDRHLLGASERLEAVMSEKHTLKCRDLLPDRCAFRFPVLAQVMEKASILWAILLSPLFWSLRNTHYVIGFDRNEHELYLFRLSLGMFGLGEATGVERIPLEKIRELSYRGGLLTATLSFRKPDGSKVKLFAPLPSRENAREIYEAVRARM
jgi:hypothetical protein